jgi:aspartyl-tRNA(Asn)/glutamyl-tRNA(Gln) amidotransferase subunit A
VAFKLGEKEDPLAMYLSDIYTVTANLVGVPAISVPVGTKVVDGVALPVGGQIMGKWFDEETVLKTAHYLEKTK